jgi:hypothetical protein
MIAGHLNPQSLWQEAVMKSMDCLDISCNPESSSTSIKRSLPQAMQNLEQVQLALREQIVRAANNGDSFDSTERLVWESVKRAGHAAMELVISLQGSGDLGEVITIGEDRQLWRSNEPTTTTVRSIFGEHRFEQFTYSAGVNKKIEFRPISTRLHLPETRWSYLLQEFSQMFCVDQAFNQAASNLERVFGSKFSVDTLEQTSARMGQQADAFLDSLPKPLPVTESEILVVSADCKGVPLIKESIDPVAAFQTARKRPGNRRMATVTSVYTVDAYERTAEQIIASLFRDPSEETNKPNRPKPTNKHTMAHLPTVFVNEDEEVPISGIIEGMAWLAMQVDQRLKPDQPCILLMDGQHALWDAASVCLGDWKVIEILDIIHVSSYVWEAAALFSTSEENRKSLTREWLLRILHGEASGVIRGLRRRGSISKLKGEKLKDLQRICDYFERNQLRMCYDKYLAAGYPIASGVIEGACGHLVKDRMERSGMRWTQEGARQMLNIRAAFQSSYWNRFCLQRIDESNEKLHPHKDLLADYQPLTIAC